MIQWVNNNYNNNLRTAELDEIKGKDGSKLLNHDVQSSPIYCIGVNCGTNK